MALYPFCSPSTLLVLPISQSSLVQSSYKLVCGLEFLARAVGELLNLIVDCKVGAGGARDTGQKPRSVN